MQDQNRTNGDQRRPATLLRIFPNPREAPPCDAQESRSIEMTALASPMDELEIGCNRGSPALAVICCLSVSFSDIRQKAHVKTRLSARSHQTLATNSQSPSCRLKDLLDDWSK